MNLSADLFPGVPLVESPLFDAAVDQMPLTEAQRDIARTLNDRGYALIDFPDPDFNARSDRIKRSLAPILGIDLADPESIRTAPGDLRVQDAWRFDEDVKAIATNAHVLDLLSALYGRPAFPFQTLNFPVGTQQSLHSDSVHFSSIPERFMCGVWVALEDIAVEAGPLAYLPGSHKWPVLSNAMIGRVGWRSNLPSAQTPFEKAWEGLIAASGATKEQFIARKGQALIWAANLLHGGEPQLNRSITRWSQVTHYYFERCIYYTPAFSDEPLGRLDLRTVTNIVTGQIQPNVYGDEVINPASEQAPRHGLRWWRRKLFGRPPSELPVGFNPELYRRLNPGAVGPGEDPAAHYLRVGRNEGRRYI